ncbi:MAG: type IV pili twitching motility protein PilT, partial [Aeromonas sp.]|nr:type IV pili twitching motility protein PilT [Aeromonas sp.]
KRNEFGAIKEIMEKSAALGMKTFDNSLFELVVEGVISEEEALKNADSANNLKLRIKLYQEDGQLKQSQATSGWSLDPIDEINPDPFA